MYLKQIILYNWKVYSGVQQFDFPAPCPEKNIVLIGALDGYGKTSLFDAIVLGVYGRDGMELVARKPSSEEKGDDPVRKPTTSYEKFLEKTLHRNAFATGERICLVQLVFIDDEGEQLKIRRRWFFTKKGTYQYDRADIWEGSDFADDLDENYESNMDYEDWYREYIAQKLLPMTLVDFFMLDGHRMNALAKHEEKKQVRKGIEGLLGIPVLTSLAKHLRAYEVSRSKGCNVSDEIKKLDQEHDQLMSEYNEKEKCHKEVASELYKCEEKQKHITNELPSSGAGLQTLLQKRYEHVVRIFKLEEAVRKDRDQIEAWMLKYIALALSSDGLRESLKQRFDSEGALQNWENDRKRGDTNLEQFINLIDDGMSSIEPALSGSQREAVLKNARNAWENVRFPKPSICPDGYLHPYLDGTQRAQVTSRLAEINEIRAPVIIETLNMIASNEDELQRKQAEYARIERKLDSMRKNLSLSNDEIVKLHQKIIKLHQKIGALKQKSKALKSAMDALDRRIKQNKKEGDKLKNELDQAKPSIRRSQNARLVASMVDEIVEKAVPSQVNAIAKAMTQAYHSMAHKKDMVERISIDEDCNVELLTSEGEDLHSYGLSDGEKQIFTHALYSAVSSVCKRNFPIVINNPLELLDKDHRKGVLKHLAQKKGQQIILLSSDEGVVGDYLREIDPHVQKKYLLHFEKVGDGGKSTVHPGYFEKA